MARFLPCFNLGKSLHLRWVGVQCSRYAEPQSGKHRLYRGLLMSEKISLTRDSAADAIAVVRLLRTGQPDMAMFLVSSYAGDPDGLQALTGSVAALANALLTTIDSMAVELNRSADTVVPGSDAVLARAA